MFEIIRGIGYDDQSIRPQHMVQTESQFRSANTSR